MVTFARAKNGLIVQHRHETLTVTAWGDSSVRVRAALHRSPADGVGALLDEPPTVDDLQVDIADDHAVLVTGELTVRVDADAAAPYPEPLISFHDTATGRTVLAEQRQHFWMPGARVFVPTGNGGHRVEQHFAAYDDEKLFGLGQHTHGCLDHKGISLDLVQRNAEVSVPFVVSSRGYGLLWNVPAVGEVEFASNRTRWTAHDGPGIDYWVTASDRPARILQRYADATGHVPDLPEWASGFWQSKLRYRNQDELMAVAREHWRRELPLSVIVADYFHWSAMGDYRFDPVEWPDPDAMIAELREHGVELMVSVWPTVSPLSENYPAFRDQGLLVGAEQGVEFQQTIQDKGMAAPMPVAFYDPTNPATRSFVWDLLRRHYLDRGARVFWLDACEPELNPAQPANMRLWAGPGARTANVYPRDNARMVAEGMRDAGEQPTVLLCRSAWAGAQRYGAAVWSGDIPATWDSLRRQVRAGLSIAMSGIPWWTTDIGGFHGGDSRDDAYCELMIRWFEFGTFCPLFRLHGDREPRTPTGFEQTGGPNEVWSFGDLAYGILRDHLHLRERLRPYIHRAMARAAQEGLPPMRPLFVDFPDDPAAWEITDAYLFGDDLLVAPVLDPDARRREVYLPAGTVWVDVTTGTRYEGGETVTIDAPLERIPVLARAGADVLAVFGRTDPAAQPAQPARTARTARPARP